MIETPRDREATFEPSIISKGQTRITSMDDPILSLYAKGMSTGDIADTFQEMYGADSDLAKAGQITGNLNTLIMLRVKNEITARILTDQIPKARIYTKLAATQVTDNNDPGTDIDFTTRSEDRVTETEMDMLIPADLIQLPKGQAFALLEGGQLYKLRLPLPGNDPLLPQDIEEIGRERLTHYGADHA